jgi:hypothetical protein
MTTPTNKQAKASLQRWKINHRPQHLALQRKYMKKRYHWNKIQSVFLAILLD